MPIISLKTHVVNIYSQKDLTLKSLCDIMDSQGEFSLKQKGGGKMSEKQKQILNILKEILPRMNKEDQSYLLGYGEGVVAGMKQESEERSKAEK